MKKNDFDRFVIENNIPDAAYSLNGLTDNGKYGTIFDDIMILDRKGIWWVVYYFEKGKKDTIQYHFTYEKALDDLAARLSINTDYWERRKS